MHAILEDLEKFQKQLRDGAVRRSYRALLSYMMQLRAHFRSKYPELSVSTLYQGYLDMTYFAISTPALKRRELKIAIVFNYEAFRFEAWLAGRNRNVNRQYWELLRTQQLPGYRIVTPGKGVDSIIEYDLAQGCDLVDVGALTKNIEKGANRFMTDIEALLPPAA